MDTDRILSIIQIFVSAFLIISVMVQNKGVGLSGVFGGEGNVYRTKRGAERFIFYATILLAVALGGISVAKILL